MKMERSKSPASAANARFIEHFKEQPGRWLCCVVRERVPTKPGVREEYDSRTMTVDREFVDLDLAGYLFHHYSEIGGIPVFDKYEGPR